MEPSVKESEVNEICYKLINACDEKAKLDAKDAEQILQLISKLISMNVDKRREDVEASIYECLGEASIIESLGADNADETFVHYLTSTYAKVYEDVVTTHDFDSMGCSSEDIEIQNDSDNKSPVEGLVVSKELKNELTKLRKWEFNVFSLSALTPYPLAVVVEASMEELCLVNDLDLSELKLRRFLIAIQNAYQELPYHNYMHGADVTQTVFHMCTEGALIEALCVSNLGALAMIIAAAVHDVGHPGVTGKFIVAVSDPLSITYNDQSPLENMHLALAFQLWNITQNNFTEKMPRLLYKDLRKMIIDLVLATDNDMHFGLVGKVTEMITSGELSSVVQAQMTAASTTINLVPPTATGRSSLSTTGSGTGSSSGLPITGRARLASTENQYSSMKRMQSERAHSPTHNMSHTNLLVATGDKSAVHKLSGERPPGMVKKLSLLSIDCNSLSHGMNSPEGALSGGATVTTPRGGTVTTRAARVSSIVLSNPATGETSAYLPMKSQQLLVLQAALHAADISGPAKPWEIHTKWTSLVMEEFYKQGDKERELNMPITYAFDRYQPVPMPKFQLGFIKAIVNPLYKILTKIQGFNVSVALECMEKNTKKWESKQMIES